MSDPYESLSVSPREPAPRCSECNAPIARGAGFCGTCGARQNSTEEARRIAWLLDEIGRWESEALLSPEDAARLRGRYEKRLEALRTPAPPPQPPPAPIPPTTASPAEAPVPAIVVPPRRSLLETLTDPHNLRLLLYAGAAMIVVSVILWLRDLLYLKLQEPIVQASLLALITLSFTAGGWYTTLRTRQRLTGSALTLAGALLAPVNFWFLVRSGLVADRGRAWLVCLLCAALYAGTALLLRQRLYVYLGCAAVVATLCSLVFRFEREAFGLYALGWMAASLLFLHLSLAARRTPAGAAPSSEDSPDSGMWSTPLLRCALAGASLSALLYLPLRLATERSPKDGFLRLQATDYDAGVAMLLFLGLAYTVWFAGRYLRPARRVSLYTLGVLAVFWTEFLTLDGLRVRTGAGFLALAAGAAAIAASARLVSRARDKPGDAAIALHRGGLVAALALAIATPGLLLNGPEPSKSVLHGIGLATLAAAFALLSARRLHSRAAPPVIEGALGIFFASIAILVLLRSAQFGSDALFVVVCALWAFCLDGAARFLSHERREEQLIAPAARAADAWFIVLFLWAAVIASLLHFSDEPAGLRPAMLLALAGAFVYGAWRAVRDRSVTGGILGSMAYVSLVAASADALREASWLPQAWTDAAVIIVAAFGLRAALGRAGIRGEQAPPSPAEINTGRPAHGAASFAAAAAVLDTAVCVCAALWFVRTVLDVGAHRNFIAASVLLLALLYWAERAYAMRLKAAARVAAIHAGAFGITLLVALHVGERWFAAILSLALFPSFFVIARAARVNGAGWLNRVANEGCAATLGIAFVAAIVGAAAHLRLEDAGLFAPCATAALIAGLSLAARILSPPGLARARYVRMALAGAVLAFWLGAGYTGYDPLGEIEVYTAPVGVLLLVIAYLSLRREPENMPSGETQMLLWVGGILLCVPPLVHAAEFRLIRDVPAIWRDLATLCAALVLVFFGAAGRLRAPALVGGTTLVLELMLLALTSVNWLQVPLKIYLGCVGSALVIAVWMLEFRREHVAAIRSRFQRERRRARSRFERWR